MCSTPTLVHQGGKEFTDFRRLVYVCNIRNIPAIVMYFSCKKPARFFSSNTVHRYFVRLLSVNPIRGTEGRRWYNSQVLHWPDVQKQGFFVIRCLDIPFRNWLKISGVTTWPTCIREVLYIKMINRLQTTGNRRGVGSTWALINPLICLLSQCFTIFKRWVAVNGDIPTFDHLPPSALIWFNVTLRVVSFLWLPLLELFFPRGRVGTFRTPGCGQFVVKQGSEFSIRLISSGTVEQFRVFSLLEYTADVLFYYGLLFSGSLVNRGRWVLSIYINRCVPLCAMKRNFDGEAHWTMPLSLSYTQILHSCLKRVPLSSICINYCLAQYARLQCINAEAHSLSWVIPILII